MEQQIPKCLTVTIIDKKYPIKSQCESVQRVQQVKELSIGLFLFLFWSLSNLIAIYQQICVLLSYDVLNTVQFKQNHASIPLDNYGHYLHFQMTNYKITPKNCPNLPIKTALVKLRLFSLMYMVSLANQRQRKCQYWTLKRLH